VTCIVSVNGLGVKFGEFWAVRDVSFSVEVGQIFGFLGANGAGKTTTIRVICGLITPTQGQVTVDGEHFERGREDAIKAKVGYMSQKFTLYNDLSIEENLDFAATIHGISKADLRRNKEELFDLIKLNRAESTLVAQLPSGIKQQVALVAALIHQPKLVVLDEPTAGVSPASRASFWELIRKLTTMGKTVFVTTHYMDEAENCDVVALMRSGELIAMGSVPQLKENTFKEQMYNVTPSPLFSSKDLNELKGLCKVIEPCGIHYHVLLNAGADFHTMDRKIDVEKIQPSLEDVFIQLVEHGGG
jgi:ABC-2 type transport system ATP-binding protein